MKLPRSFDRVLVLITAFLMAFTISSMISTNARRTYAADENGIYEETEEHFVSFYDEGEKLTVRTNAATVGEALERAGIQLALTDIVDPGLDTPINSDNFFINIHRSRPAVVRLGATERYIMTASYDAMTIALEAGLTIYDGDEVRQVPNTNFLEAGVASVYEVIRNGGRTITEEMEIGYAEEEVRDYNLEKGKREVRQLGEVGLKKITYEVKYVDGVEVERQVVNEAVVRAPVSRIVAVGAKKSLSPDTAECVSWARAAGVSDADMSAAIDLIYHESGCRVDATNASSGAYGIPQALPGSKMAAYGADWETNPVTQIKWMANYVKNRYGGWMQAIDYWYNHGWY